MAYWIKGDLLDKEGLLDKGDLFNKGHTLPLNLKGSTDSKLIHILAPPSYEESQLGRCDNDQDDFLPRYTYYRFGNQ